MATHDGVSVLDNLYLVITALITIGYQLIGFSIAFTLKFDKLTDFMGGTNFIILAVVTLAMSGVTFARNIVASIFLILWAARLSGFLLFRILKTGSDDRFDDKRDKFFPFLGFWAAQAVWVWTVSLPVTILNSPRVRQDAQPDFGYATDIIGVIFFAIGFTIEAVSDIQKYRFKQSSAAKKPEAVCDVGFFKYSRHPNYFGEILVQLSIFLVCITPVASGDISQNSSAGIALLCSMMGVFLLTGLLMFLSGLPLQERPGAKKRYEKGQGWPEYSRYLQETSILIPMPPGVWNPLPVFIKRTIGLEFPMYVFDPKKHADESKRAENGGRGDSQSSGQGGRESHEPLNAQR